MKPTRSLTTNSFSVFYRLTPPKLTLGGFFIHSLHHKHQKRLVLTEKLLARTILVTMSNEYPRYDHQEVSRPVEELKLPFHQEALLDEVIRQTKLRALRTFALEQPTARLDSAAINELDELLNGPAGLIEAVNSWQLDTPEVQQEFAQIARYPDRPVGNPSQGTPQETYTSLNDKIQAAKAGEDVTIDYLQVMNLHHFYESMYTHLKTLIDPNVLRAWANQTLSRYETYQTDPQSRPAKMDDQELIASIRNLENTLVDIDDPESIFNLPRPSRTSGKEEPSKRMSGLLRKFLRK